ncbi:hypothetical protein KBD18_02620 [Patescibacteria group bacterium]|nr:hypothetical protein [Patescibacteria group bacterium]
MGDRAAFRLELFSRGGNPQSPVERVFELPCPGLPADARVFGILRSDGADTTATLASLIRNAIRSIETLNKRTLASGLEGKFEAILLAVNRGYAELAASGTVPSEPLPDALFGMIVEHDLFLTGHGAVDAFLLRPEEGQQPRRLLEKETAGTDTRTLFRTIVSGTLKPNDTLLVTVSGLFNYLALPHLTRVLSTLPARDARTRILELLGDVPPSIPLSGIIVGPPPADAARPAISPAIFRRHASTTPKTETVKKPSILQTYGPVVAASSRKGAAALGKTLLGGLRMIPKALSGAVAFIREPSARGGLRRRWKTLPDRTVAWWNKLPARSKILCIAGVLFVLLFGEGLRFLLRSQQQEADISGYNQAVAAIQTQRDAAEASMIYKNEAAAWQQLSNAEVATRELPQQTDAQRKTASDLLAQIESDREKLRHHISIQDAALLFNVPSGGGIGTTLFSSKQRITLVSDQGGAWNWDRSEKPLGTAVSPFLPTGTVQRAFLNTRGGLLFFTGNDFTERVATQTIHTALNLPTKEKIAAVTLWKDRAYTLIPTANQVYRGTRSGNTWNIGTAALKNPTITDGTDIAIDTAVWISTSSTIRKYLAGEDQHFSLKPFEPPPQHLARIWLGAETDPLIAFDDKSKRILIINKDGSLRAQLSGGPANDLRDVAIDSANKSLLLLTTKAVFQVPMPE